MRKTIKKALACSLTLALVATGTPGTGTNIRQAFAEDETVLEVNADHLYASNQGVFQGWGTSLCWFGNRIGGSQKTSQEAAELFCNEETGLGLNIIRFNIGGGDAPSHDHITRTDSKMPGYWGEYDEETDTFTYDFTKDENQRNVLLKMLEQNPDLHVEAFSNSAPYFMTVSGCTSGSEDGGDNLKSDKYDEFAEYLATVIKNYKELYGVEFRSVEAMNENGWSIERNGYKQEGCSFGRGASQSKMILALDNVLKKNNLQDLILAGCDESSPAETKKALELMSEDARKALERIDTHTYSTASEAKLLETATELQKNLWMSEVDGADIAGSDAGEMGAALGFARRIAKDMNTMQPSAWIMWQAIGSYCGSEPFAGNYDPETLDQKNLDTNGFWGVTYADMDQEKVVLTKKYYGFGQYTRYIHAGDYMLVGDKNNTISYDLEDREVKIVAVNTSDQVKSMRYHISGMDEQNSSVDVIRTSGDLENGENWAQLEGLKADSLGFAADLAPNSITTFVVKGVDLPITTPVPAETEAPGETESPAAEAPSPSVLPSATETPSTTAVPADSTGTVPDAGSTTVAMVRAVKTAKLKKNTATVSWKKADGADKYAVAYSTGRTKLTKVKNGSKKAVSGVKVKTTAKDTIRIKGLKKGTTYYVKVCGYHTASDGIVYGKYSVVKKFKTKKK